MAYRKPTDKELIESYDRLRLYAGMVSRGMKDTVGGDQYAYVGGMNPVDDMRDALEEVEGLLIVGAPNEPGTTIDHRDAWNVAHHRKAESNLARAYIELRQLSKVMWEGPITDEEQERLKAILHANDL